MDFEFTSGKSIGCAAALYPYYWVNVRRGGLLAFC